MCWLILRFRLYLTDSLAGHASSGIREWAAVARLYARGDPPARRDRHRQVGQTKVQPFASVERDRLVVCCFDSVLFRNAPTQCISLYLIPLLYLCAPMADRIFYMITLFWWVEILNCTLRQYILVKNMRIWLLTIEIWKIRSGNSEHCVRYWSPVLFFHSLYNQVQPVSW